jgi:fibronectin-binding autotransporter adhesin
MQFGWRGLSEKLDDLLDAMRLRSRVERSRRRKGQRFQTEMLEARNMLAANPLLVAAEARYLAAHRLHVVAPAHVSSPAHLTGGGSTLKTGGTLTLTTANTYTGGTWMTGTGTLTLSGANTYTGGTTVNNGTIAVNGGTLTLSTSTLSAPGTVALVPNNSVTLAGSIVLPIAGPTFETGSSLGSNTNLIVSGGTLRFNSTTGPGTIGSGVTATVSNGAILELPGTVSALDDASATQRVHIVNDSTYTLNTGNLVSSNTLPIATNSLDGTGTVTLNASADLTANHVVQSALVINGAPTTTGIVTINASDATGNPLSVAGNLLPPASSLSLAASAASSDGSSSSAV